MSHGSKHTSIVCSKQCAKTQMTCKKSRYESYRQLVGRKVRAQPLQLNLKKLTRVIYLQMCAAIPQQYIH